MKVGQKVRIFSSARQKIRGKVVTVSPVMEKVKYLTPSYEMENTFTKIEISFDNKDEALKFTTPGERLFVRIYF